MKVVLISTYELGRQPFGLASPAAQLRADGHEVVCADASVGPIPAGPVREAGIVAFFLPMHTATRLAAPLIGRVRELNPRATLCCYGLYAAMNAEYLRSLGVSEVLGGEFETGLRAIANGAAPPGTRVIFRTPDRSGLPALSRYAKLHHDGEEKFVAYTEASRGCKHLCRHCPVVPVYQGRFHAVPVEVVLTDIAQQVEAGAGHVTFGDPDFFNGPTHAVRIVEAIHARWRELTYDVTIKIEHLLRHRDLLGVLRRTGCVMVTSAVESLDDAVLARLDKGHTRADFVEAVGLCRDAGLNLSPTFIPFTPWTSRAGYRDLLRALVELDWVAQVAPIQLALRLLIPAGSLLAELPEVQAILQPFEPAALLHRWAHPDPSMDRLAGEMLAIVHRAAKRGAGRIETFAEIWQAAHGSAPDFHLVSRAAVPYLTEPWYC